jgi:hypothetical protein
MMVSVDSPIVTMELPFDTTFATCPTLLTR